MDRVSSDTSPTQESISSKVESRLQEKADLDDLDDEEKTPSKAPASDILEETRPASGTAKTPDTEWPLEEQNEDGEPSSPGPVEQPFGPTPAEGKKVRFAGDTPPEYFKTAERGRRGSKGDGNEGANKSKGEGSSYSEGEPFLMLNPGAGPTCSHTTYVYALPSTALSLGQRPRCVEIREAHSYLSAFHSLPVRIWLK